eukprot:TRINITY_DN3948_c2_g1_i3.p1 TRINITY_DN3948_c2_g1~~TRINITY_DN3948_c2_g1_i3.p1  ORF type:complete len:367 (-),score=61.47 TRINITY_DN3948_c2_g1_i3:74-1174(-)
MSKRCDESCDIAGSSPLWQNLAVPRRLDDGSLRQRRRRALALFALVFGVAAATIGGLPFLASPTPMLAPLSTAAGARVDGASGAGNARGRRLQGASGGVSLCSGVVAAVFATAALRQLSARRCVRRRPGVSRVAATAGRIGGAAGQGDGIVFHGAKVVSNEAAAAGLRLLRLQVDQDVGASFLTPGQYVQAKLAPNSASSFFAISSPPGELGALDLLIKEAPANTGFLRLRSGGEVLVSSAQGNGFFSEGTTWFESDVNQVGLYATGSGIAPMRAVIESGLLRGKASRLYFGARTEAHLAYADRFPSWRREGVEVIPVLSRAGASWKGRRGYVQSALFEDEEFASRLSSTRSAATVARHTMGRLPS